MRNRRDSDKETKSSFVYPSIQGAFGKVRDDSSRVEIKTDSEGNVVSMRKQVKSGMFGSYHDVGDYTP